MAAAFVEDRFETGPWVTASIPIQDTFELGSLIAALAEETEDEFELDLRVRARIEAGGVHVFQRIAASPVDASPGEGSRLEN